MEKSILTLKEAVAYSGFSKSYFYRLTQKGLIKTYKPLGKLIFIKKDDLEAFLLKNPNSQNWT